MHVLNAQMYGKVENVGKPNLNVIKVGIFESSGVLAHALVQVKYA